MKFIYFAHSEMSIRCLEGLIAESCVPVQTVISIKDGTHEHFKSEMKVLCELNDIRLTNICNSCEPEDLENLKSVEELAEMMKELDFGLSVGFMKILPESVFAAPRLGTLNLHCGKLPEYRGRAPISRTIMNGDEYLVVTVHQMDSGMDSGDVIEESELKINPDDDVNTMYEKCCEVSSQVALAAISKLLSGKHTFRKQESDMTPNEKISEHERRIEWNTEAHRIFNKIRAITFPYPGAKTNYGGMEFVILSSEEAEDVTDVPAEPGTIIEVKDKSIKVAAMKNALILRDFFFNGGLVKDLTAVFKEGGKFD
jgi:methionyl-tRNA formyltransferase